MCDPISNIEDDFMGMEIRELAETTKGRRALDKVAKHHQNKIMAAAISRELERAVVAARKNKKRVLARKKKS